MRIESCPKCNKPNVETRYSKNNHPYLAEVEPYPSGHSYFRGLHTSEACTAYKADFDARVAATVVAEEAERLRVARGREGMKFAQRFKSVFGECPGYADTWDRVYARWLSDEPTSLLVQAVTA